MKGLLVVLSVSAVLHPSGVALAQGRAAPAPVPAAKQATAIAGAVPAEKGEKPAASEEKAEDLKVEKAGKTNEPPSGEGASRGKTSSDTHASMSEGDRIKAPLGVSCRNLAGMRRVLLDVKVRNTRKTVSQMQSAVSCSEVSWQKVARAEAYRVYWSTQSGFQLTEAKSWLRKSSPICHDRSDVQGTVFYRVAAMRGGVEGVPSEEVKCGEPSELVAIGARYVGVEPIK